MKKTLILLLSAVLTMPIFAQNNFEKHNFSMNAGYAYKATDLHPEQYFVAMSRPGDHAKAMKHGFELEFDYDYRFHKLFSVGFKASMWSATHTYDSIKVDDTYLQTGRCSDDMNIFYVGPTFKFQLPTIANHWDIWARATVGYLNMRNTDKANGVSATYSGDCFGWGLGFGVDYSISRYIGVGASFGLLGGTVSTLKMGEDEFDISGYDEALHRFNINIGVRIRL